MPNGPPEQSEPAVVERADSRRKRRRLLAAAKVMVAEQGLDISSAELAARAEVGVGTLYRRFGSKEALLKATLLDVMLESNAAADRAVAGTEPVRDLEEFLAALVEQWVSNRGLAEFIANSDVYHSDVFVPHVTKIRDALAELTARAQRVGSIREDVTWRDILALVQAAASPVDVLGIMGTPAHWRRSLTVMLDGLAAKGSRTLPGEPPVDGPLAPRGGS